jgi:hypothetical protein
LKKIERRRRRKERKDRKYLDREKWRSTQRERDRVRGR